jgi:hypothetical protein
MTRLGNRAKGAVFKVAVDSSCWASPSSCQIAASTEFVASVLHRKGFIRHLKSEEATKRLPPLGHFVDEQTVSGNFLDYVLTVLTICVHGEVSVFESAAHVLAKEEPTNHLESRIDVSSGTHDHLVGRAMHALVPSLRVSSEQEYLGLRKGDCQLLPVVTRRSIEGCGVSCEKLRPIGQVAVADGIPNGNMARGQEYFVHVAAPAEAESFEGTLDRHGSRPRESSAD